MVVSPTKPMREAEATNAAVIIMVRMFCSRLFADDLRIFLLRRQNEGIERQRERQSRLVRTESVKNSRRSHKMDFFLRPLSVPLSLSLILLAL